jgi:hypothetical protein
MKIIAEENPYMAEPKEVDAAWEWCLKPLKEEKSQKSTYIVPGPLQGKMIHERFSNTLI